MNAPLVSVAQLLHDLDDLKTATQTLPAHFAIGCDAHVRERYAGLLATILLAQGNITEAQSRLFRLLLAALDLPDTQARLFEQAPDTSRDVLGECARLFGEHGLVLSFLVDAAVLLRLAGPLPAEQQQLLCELADLFNMPPADLALVADLAAIVLGMEPAQDVPPQFDYAIVNVWGDYLYRPLTVQRLTAGPLSGRWKVTAPMKLDTGWELDDAWIRFEADGRIDTKTDEIAQVRVVGCKLENPVMTIGENLIVNMLDSEIKGDYAESAKITAITLGVEKGQAKKKDYDDKCISRFSNLKVSTKNARSFLIANFPVAFANCHFIHCGNPHLIGGAIAAYRVDSDIFRVPVFSVFNSSFAFCSARLGGGIRISGLGDGDGGKHNTIENTHFDHCTSLAYRMESVDQKIGTYVFGGGAIFSDMSYAYNSCISGGRFSNASVQLGFCCGSGNHIGRSTFKQSWLVLTSGSVRHYDIRFENESNNAINKPIEMDVNKQSWWYEYQ